MTEKEKIPNQAPAMDCFKIKFYPSDLAAEPLFKEFADKSEANLWINDLLGIADIEAPQKYVLYHYGKNEDCQENDMFIFTSVYHAPDNIESKMLCGNKFHNIMLCDNLNDAIAVCEGWMEPYPLEKRKYVLI